ncbi:MAG: B12-binding domain-containing radical SAM protein [Phycisphaeraceae bacterium]|nr:B12-binding domain-containing radical SAM protein [Phycisphaeraceae bacterium]
MPDIVLTTLNARYAHAAFGLRYLMVNLGELRDRAAIVEFDLTRRSVDVVEAILALQPRIVGFGVYIWNVHELTLVVAQLKRLRPDITIVLGGPEVSYDTTGLAIVDEADYVIAGEADLAFAEICRKLLAGDRPLIRRIEAATPDLNDLALPYDLYTDEDIAHRVVYVEASRGCPFSCEFCLSSLDVPVRAFPLEPFLAAMQRLLDRGLKQFKFVDRTFNLDLRVSRAILDFFLQRQRPGLFLHFEMIPDRFPPVLRELVQAFAPGTLQFEVGIQTFNEDIAQRISRRQDNAKVEENLRFLRDKTQVHVHADLIVGLPGEDVAGFAAGFDRLVALRPQEIQVGMLKRLRGTPIARHDEVWQMIYSPHSPYEILQNSAIDFPTMQRLRRFARYWDLIANSGRFHRTLPRLWDEGSPFARFMDLSDWLYAASGRTHAIALPRLTMLVRQFLLEIQGISAQTVDDSLDADGLRQFIAGGQPRPTVAPSSRASRQQRHRD